MCHLEIALERGLIVVILKGFPLSGEVIELAILLRVADLLLDDPAPVEHRRPTPFSVLSAECLAAYLRLTDAVLPIFSEYIIPKGGCGVDLVIAGLPATGVIVALVEGAKRAGLPTRYAPLLAMLLGIACGLLVHVVAMRPDAHAWYDAASGGLVLGLSAAGLYSGVRAVARPARGDGTYSA